MKRRGLNYLENNMKLEITIYHQIASLLCPSFKTLKMYNTRTKLAIVKKAKDMLDEKFPFHNDPGTMCIP